MKIDPEDLRQHYASLGDEELLAMERDELMPVAMQIYDQEISRRGLDHEDQPGDQPEDHSAGEGQSIHGIHVEDNWIETAATACSAHVRSSADDNAQKMLLARDILIAAGIPAEVRFRKEEDSGEVCEALAPANLIMYAESVLDKELFNQDVEESYRTYFASLSDEDLRSADRELLFAGLTDRLARAKKAYAGEVARRADAANA